VHSPLTGARNSHDVNVEHFARDLETVFQEFSGQYNKIFVVGHSYGGTGVVLGNQSFTAASLWDPTYDLADDEWMEKITEPVGDHEFKLIWNNIYLCGNQQLEIAKKYDLEECRRLSKSLKFPIQVFLSENFKPEISNESFHTFCLHETEYFYMPQSNHFFDDLTHAQDIIDKTVSWFGKYLN
jgi:hypothetical protein